MGIFKRSNGETTGLLLTALQDVLDGKKVEFVTINQIELRRCSNLVKETIYALQIKDYIERRNICTFVTRDKGLLLFSTQTSRVDHSGIGYVRVIEDLL